MNDYSKFLHGDLNIQAFQSQEVELHFISLKKEVSNDKINLY